MDAPHPTPPVVVRSVSHEDLALELADLKRWRGEDYTSLRSIEARMEAHHLAQMEQLGILARAMQAQTRRPRLSLWGLFK